MMRFGLIAVVLAGLSGAAMAQTVPVPRPSPEERAAAAEAREQAARSAEAEPPSAEIAPTAAAQDRPLTDEESAAFRVRVGACWNAGVLSPGARQVGVTIRFELTPEAVPVAESFALVGQTGPEDVSQDDVAMAIEAARRAVLRCGADGYDLPPEAMAYWRIVQITFAPAEGALR